ncbi:7869_t:CDS:2, partial [Racocetra fulgida]
EGYGQCGIQDDGLELIETCKKEKTLAFSFDDGPRPFGIKATFFVNGHNSPEFCIYDHAELLLQMYNEGHQIGHHSWSHLRLGNATPEEIEYQLALLRRGYKYIAGLDIDTTDSRSDLDISRRIFSNLIQDKKPHISLNHDRVNCTADFFVPYAIRKAKQLGYNFDTIAGCIGKNDKHDWYNIVGKPQKRDYKTWRCTPDDRHGGLVTPNLNP